MHSRRVTITTGDNCEAVIFESANKQMVKSINYQVQRTVHLSVSFLACMPLWVPSFESHDSKAGSTANVARQPSRDESSCTVTACGHDWGQTVHQDSGDALLVMELETALVRTTCVDSVLPTPLSTSAPRCSAALTPSSWPSEFERPLTVEEAGSLQTSAVPTDKDVPNTQKVPAWAIVLDAEPSRKIIKDEDTWMRLVKARMPWRVKDKVTGIVMLLVPPATRDQAPFYLALSEMTHEEWVRLQLKKSDSLDKQGWLDAMRERKDSPSLLDPGQLWREAYRYYVPNRNLDIKNSLFGGTFQHKDQLEDFLLNGLRKMPLDNLSRGDILDLISKCGFRLPTHEEWVRALVPDSIKSFETMVRYEANAAVFVGEKRNYLPSGALLPRNALGFSNLYGNMWELLDDGRVIGGACDSTERACRDLEPRSPSGRWIGARLVKDP